MKEDNISQLGDYDPPFCEQQNTHGSYYISLFKFKSFDQFIPQTDPNFRHLLSCGTIICSEMSDTQNNITMYHGDLFKVALRQNFHIRL